MAKLYVGYKRKYYGLFGAKQMAESMGIDTENYKATEEDKKFMKEHDFKHKETQLESGRIKSQFFFKKKRKPH